MAGRTSVAWITQSWEAPQLSLWANWSPRGRHRTDHDSLDPQGTLTRHHDVQRWNPTPQWAISQKPAHPALVSEEQFIAVQAIHTTPVPVGGTPRCYVLTGLVCCGICGRVMDSHWVHQRPGYRCRHGHNSARSTSSAAKDPLHPRRSSPGL